MGEITRRLLKKWSENVGLDIEAQIRKYGQDIQSNKNISAPTPYQFKRIILDLQLNIDDRQVVILGGTGAVGIAIAEGFLVEGANVCLIGRNKHKLKESYKYLSDKYENQFINIISGDASIEGGAEKIYSKIIEQDLIPDILVTNIGNGSIPNKPIDEINIFKDSFNVNFLSNYKIIQLLSDCLMSKSAAITMISSIAGLEVIGAPTAYSIAKNGIIALNKNLAKKMGPDVRVNVVSPGNIMFEGSVWQKKVKENPSMVKELIENNVALKRFAKPKEIADAVVFLSSERASFITGSSLIVDGGQTVGI